MTFCFGQTPHWALALLPLLFFAPLDILPSATGVVLAVEYQYSTLTVPFSAGDSALKLNPTGQIVGEVDGQDGTTRGYLAEGGAASTIYAAPGAKFTSLSSANASGIWGGYLLDARDSYHGFLRHPDGAVELLDFPGEDLNYVNDLNESGLVVGGASLFGWFRRPGEALEAMATPGYQVNTAWGVSAQGIIAGTSWTGFFSDANGLLYDTKDHSFTIFNPPGADETHLYDINSAGDFVGEWRSGPQSPWQAFVRYADGSLSSIAYPGAIATRVWGIGEDGTLVGRYLDQNEVRHSFVATPVPEPASMLLLLVGAAALACGRFWRTQASYLNGKETR